VEPLVQSPDRSFDDKERLFERSDRARQVSAKCQNLKIQKLSPFTVDPDVVAELNMPLLHVQTPTTMMTGTWSQVRVAGAVQEVEDLV
jgi:hypothetical protein